MFNKKDKNKDNRFKMVYQQGGLPICTIIVDTETGINYLLTGGGYGEGLTVLLDKDGKPVISQV